MSEFDALSRRELVRGISGGFGVAASGLLLPEWLVEDAAARGHPTQEVQHRADKRRQRKHRRVKRKRRQHRRSSDASRRPGAFIKGVRMSVFARNGLVRINWWWWTLVPYNNSEGPIEIANGDFSAISKDDLNLAVSFNPIFGKALPPGGFLYVLARNPIGTPDVSVYYAKDLSQTPIASYQSVDQGVTLSVDADMYENEPVRLSIKREKDSDDYKQFSITVGPPD